MEQGLRQCGMVNIQVPEVFMRSLGQEQAWQGLDESPYPYLPILAPKLLHLRHVSHICLPPGPLRCNPPDCVFAPDSALHSLVHSAIEPIRVPPSQSSFSFFSSFRGVFPSSIADAERRERKRRKRQE